MTVSELITELQKLPQDLTVVGSECVVSDYIAITNTKLVDCDADQESPQLFDEANGCVNTIKVVVIE